MIGFDIPEIFITRGVALSADERNSLEQYARLLLDLNKRINLISRRTVENVWIDHILHSLAPLIISDVPARSQILDLGTGGGLPGIPLAIVRPSARFVLVDSIQKKINAINQITEKLGLRNVKTVCSRVERLANHPDHKGRYDIVLARGVAPLSELIRWARPLIANPRSPRGRQPSVHSRELDRCLVAYKGGDLSGEIKKAQLGTADITIEEIPIQVRDRDAIRWTSKKLVVVRF